MPTTSGLHRDFTGASIHVPHAFEYADAATRTAATGFVPADVHKLALQLDNSSLWILIDDSPATWIEIGGGASAFTALTDVPSSYTGEAGKLAAVKGDESGLEFIDAPTGGGGGSLDFQMITLSIDVACSGAGWDDCLELALDAGTWDIAGVLTGLNPVGGSYMTLRIYDGTTTYATSEGTTASATFPLTFVVKAKVVLTVPSTVKIQVNSPYDTMSVLSEAVHAADGANASTMTALRVDQGADSATEVVDTVSASGGTETIDLDIATVKDLTLSADCTLTFSNAPAAGIAGSFTLILRQDGTGGWVTTWPTVQWAGGVAPTLTLTAGATDILTFLTVDGGTTWYGFAAGLDFS